MVITLRGDDVWVGGRAGTVRRYKPGELVASIPAHATEIQLAAVGRNALATVGGDSSVILVRADAAQIIDDAPICPSPVIAGMGMATTYECDNAVKVYWGRQQLGEYPLR